MDVPTKNEEALHFDLISREKRLGKNNNQIAELLSRKFNGLYDTTYVSKLVRKFTNRLNVEFDITEEKFNTIDNLDWIISQATEAWIQSQQFLERKTIKQGPTDKKFKYIDKAKSIFQKGHEKIIEKLESAGDPKYLDLILKATMAKAKITGALDINKAQLTIYDLLAQLDMTDEVEESRVISPSIETEEDVLRLDSLNAFTPSLPVPNSEYTEYDIE